MLKQELVKIKLRKNLIDYYSNLGYEIDTEIEVLSEHLHKGSGTIVSVEFGINDTISNSISFPAIEITSL